MSDDREIGMFDSGFGGLTVARALIDLLPVEHLVYLGDTGRYPYGPRPLAEVREFATEITRWLIDEHDVKLIVVACNTAAAAALASLQASFPVPIVGVIEPGVRSLVKATRSGHVGVIGTVGTISSGSYQREVAALAAEAELTCAACPGFVEFVERGETASEQVHVLAERLLAPVREAKVDTLLLGCTHYPFLARTLTDVMGRDVVLVDSADETAFEVRRLLGEIGLARAAGGAPATRRWYSSGDVAWFRQLGQRLLGPELDRAEGVGVGLSLTILGCSGSFAGRGDACSGYLVQGAGTSLWIDAGPGTLANVQRHITLAELDGLVLSHSHPDHWLEAPVLRNAMRYVLGIEGLPVYGTTETLRMLTSLIDDIEPTFLWTTISAGSTATVGGLSLTFARTDHPVETLATRVDGEGRSLVYSADTGPLWTAASLGDDIDLLLCEASLGRIHEGQVQHLSGRQAGVMAREAGVARLMLTHVVPGADAAQHRLDAEAAFGATVEMATTNTRYDI